MPKGKPLTWSQRRKQGRGKKPRATVEQLANLERARAVKAANRHNGAELAQELDAMRVIAEALAPLPATSRTRIIAFLRAD